MKRVGRLFDDVCAFDHLIRSAKATLKGKRKTATAERFLLNLEPEIIRLQQELLSDDYRPGPYTCFTIFEPKRRFICAARLRDRVVHHAICDRLEPIFERRFIADSYACRKGRGVHRAVRLARQLVRKRSYYLKADVLKFFASIDHAVLKGLLRRQFKDDRLLRLMDRIIDHPVPGHAPGKGLAIGNLTSQWWANFHLDALDHFLKDELGVRHYIRYMDDMVILDDDKAALHRAKAATARFLAERLNLSLKPAATFIAPVTEGMPFLGFRIFPGVIRLRRQAKVRFQRKLQAREAAWARGEIDDATLARTVGSLIAHTRHADTWRLRTMLIHGDAAGR